MATPLTDSINALTAYANEVTGGSDTNLSDAVHTLASGYGGGSASVKTTTVTIPENTWNRAHTIAQFFRDELDSPIAILEISLVESYSIDQQLVSYKYNKVTNSPYNVTSTKYRLSSENTGAFPWGDSSYALAVAEGTHYNVTYIA